MRILLTGAAGFLGSHLAERLLREGHQVVGVDNFASGQRRNIAHLSAFSGFQFLEADAARPLEVEGPLDWVMHFASPASPPRYLKLPLETLLVNAEGTRHLLDLALVKGARFFLASTSEVYGDPQVHPQPEGYWGHVNPIGPRSIYDESKRYAEALTLAYHRTKGVPVRIVRIFNTYGPRMDPEDGRVVTNFITQALQGRPLTIYGQGQQTRSFQYVDDLIEGIRRLMEVDYPEPVNLGNPEEYTMLELARLVLELTGSSSPLVYEPLPQDDPKQRRPDITRAQNLLGWQPRVPVREGLARTIAYFRELLPAERGSL
ncbi:MAG: SDR family oxidoreductase [Meiothermus sp.]|uniref:UDP-glucuronic acid decarboxylase family protein n=1 Tax=Meiothermus sp. TaxID=1955249 RepID=UPI0025FF3A7B|nr:UDP-glucuronic acid decarboxylase family protein [Meiothermus sp.]MCS7058157.1 SDR family oxidoreductase [Meiothermus sp.]MCS7193328.1 SDR family oxidoreductase [Meiothermus sp.]MCX7740881.1 SDR family oxidoreductase [Meiothermus sp.]MDW8091222.1 SDR family oxidoreductase [Meiothermus sp.]MDW8481992.1 SDR family oxidoreductase [Meiothermus sp.]